MQVAATSSHVAVQPIGSTCNGGRWYMLAELAMHRAGVKVAGGASGAGLQGSGSTPAYN